MRSLLNRIVLPIPSGTQEHQQHHDEAVHHQPEHILGDGDIQRADDAAGGFLHQLPLVRFPFRGDAEPLVLLPFFDVFR